MSYKITITNNETGEILLNNENAVAIVGGISDETRAAQFVHVDCNEIRLACATFMAEKAIAEAEEDMGAYFVSTVKKVLRKLTS